MGEAADISPLLWGLDAAAGASGEVADAGHRHLLDPVDRDILTAGLAGLGVVTGGAVTAQGSPNMTVAVAAVTVRDQEGQTYDHAGSNVTITTADATNPRIDLIINGAGGNSAIAGTPAANPVLPSFTPGDGEVPLAAVYVPANDTAIGSTQIIDKRVILPAPIVAGLTAPTEVQRTSTNGNHEDPTITIAAAASGHTILLGWNGVGRGITSISCTNVTFTKMGEYTSAGAFYELWAGVVAGGSSGTTITVNTASENYWSAQTIEIADAVTPTAGTPVTGVKLGDGFPSVIGPLTFTAGNLVAIVTGCDNTTAPFVVILPVPSLTVIGTTSGQGVSLSVCFAPSGSLQAISLPGSGPGGFVAVEIT